MACPPHGFLLPFTQLLFRCPLLSQASPYPPSPILTLITITPFSPCFIIIIVHVMTCHISLVYFLSPHQNTSSTKVGTFLLLMVSYIPNAEDRAWHRIGNQLFVELMDSSFVGTETEARRDHMLC